MKLACLWILACSSAVTSSCEAPPCTDVGCDDGVTIDLGPRATYGASAKLSVHVCLGEERCGDAIVSEHACTSVSGDPAVTPQLIISCSPSDDLTFFATSTSPLGAGAQTVSVTVSDEAGTKLMAATKGVATTPMFPNGPDCGTVCHTGELSLRPQS